MDELTSEISMALNALYAAYLKGAETGQGPLLTEVGRVANQTLLDDDRVENFVIMTWQALPAIKDLPCSFGGWILASPAVAAHRLPPRPPISA